MNTYCKRSLTAKAAPSRLLGKSFSAILLAIMTLLPAARPLMAQDFDNYQPLKAQGDIPDVLRKSSIDKFNAEKAKLGRISNPKEQKAKETFLMQSSFVLDEMMLSGKVVFNDPVSEYVTKVKDKLLAHDPELQAQIQTFVVKSPIANAFATHGGILLVNTGLLARLHNEAELAFVLSHEIQHYLKQHPINVYVKTDEIKQDLKSINAKSQGDFMEERSKYSRQVEQEADLLGFDLYLASGYSLSAALGVYDVLAKASQPYDEIPWEKDFFEFEYLEFPPDYRKYKLDSISTSENDADSLSTHPNIAKRRAYISAKIDSVGNDNGEVFLVSPIDFLNVRKICRFELTETYINNQAYGAAFYNSYLLLSDEPESKYLKKSMARAMYGMAKLKVDGDFEKVHRPANMTEGERQQCQYFWEKISPGELNLLAIRYVWQAHKSYPEDKELLAMTQDLVNQFHIRCNDDVKKVVKEVPAEMPAIVATMREKNKEAMANGEFIEPAKNSKKEQGGAKKSNSAKEARAAYMKAYQEMEVARFEQMSGRRNVGKTGEFMSWSLCDLFDDNEFAEVWSKGGKAPIPPYKVPRVLSGRDALMPFNFTEVRDTISAKKVVFVRPFVKRVNYLEENPVDFVESQKLSEAHEKTLGELSKGMKLDYAFLDNRKLKENQIEKFNDYVLAQELLSATLNREEPFSPLIEFRQEEADDLAKRLGTEYLVFNAVIRSTEKLSASKRLAYLGTGILIWPILPIAIYAAVKRYNYTYIATLVLDIKEMKVVMRDMRRVSGKKPEKTIKANLFDELKMIKSK